ncbi:MAG TPA: START domain-containing protein [Smithella sp.]|nr:START domain-containing protein [Smithella sp.]
MNKYLRTVMVCMVIFSFLALMPAGAAAAGDWKLAIQKDGIDVSTRPVKGSDFDEFMGVTEIDVPIGVVVAVLTDIPAGTQWMADCKENREIRKIDDHTSVQYNVTKLSWPVSDREALVLVTEKKDEKTGTITYAFHETTDPSVPVGKGNVRMPEISGQWVLTPINPNRTKVIYTVKSNPGGSIPKSLANMKSKDIPYNTLMGLKMMVKKDKYKMAAK